MESDMNPETKNPSKRRKVEVLSFDPSFLGLQSKICEEKVNDVGLSKAIKEESHLLSSDYIKSKLKRTLDQTIKPNKILLFTVINPLYSITCDTLRKICLPIAAVHRIVIFRKQGLIQAMLEFESVNAANDIKEDLNGCDIYSGCCTLSIDFSRNFNQLNVYKNDDNTYDYTNDFVKLNGPSQTETISSPRRVLLEAPNFENDTSSEKTNDQLYSNHIKRRNIPQLTLLPISGNVSTETKLPVHSDKLNGGSVCIVYGLNVNKMNTQKVFNLFCLYGNVIRIKFLKSKEGCAMIQMGDFLAVERLISLLHGVSLFGSILSVHYSKQSLISDVCTPYALPDGTLSFQDFSKSNLNRFSTSHLASKNRIQRPTKSLHFFNTPPNTEKNDVLKILENDGDHLKPISIEFFPTKSEKSSSGLISFESLDQAIEAIVMFNHQPVVSSFSKYPYIMKLCFSTSNIYPI